MTNHQAIHSENIGKCYGSIEALHRVSLNWERGKVTSILGPSGSGKTTLGEIFAGLVRPDEGQILAGGEDITTWKPDRRRISLLPQEWELFPHLTVLQNVGFGLWASGVARKSRDVRARALLLAVGLTDREHALPQELSGGQQQRVALARALAAPNPFVVLDEPFSSVDQDTRGLMRDLLSEEARQGRGILLITHDRSDALMLSNTIHCLSCGKLIMSGSPKKVYSEPVSLQAALLTGSAFLVPLFRNGKYETGSAESDGEIRRVRLPLLRSKLPLHAQSDRMDYAVARPEWLQVSQTDEFHLKGKVSSSCYSGGHYVVTLNGDHNSPYQAYVDRDIPVGTVVPFSIKRGIELPVISIN